MSPPRKPQSFFKTHFYNEKFTHHKKNFFLQTIAASSVVFCVLLSLASLSNGFIIASIASSAFLVFTKPHSPLVSATALFLGYVVGSLSGVFSYYLLMFCHDMTPFQLIYDRAFFGAFSVGISMLGMLSLRVTHPPACGVSLALVLNPWEGEVLFITVAAVLLLTGTRHLLRHHLIDLI